MDDQQPKSPSPFPELSGDLPLMPARMANEYQYCPRLAYLEWVQGEWADSADTVDGRFKHRRVDKPGGDLPAAAAMDQDTRVHARSITLSSNRLGLIAKMDLIEGDAESVTPVDYKRGKRPHTERGAYDPERVQLCVQGLILEEHGYPCTEGVLYFVASKERVRVIFDEDLRALTHNAINGLRLMAAGGQAPAPLEDSPKCPRCSLVGICLPDEVHYLKQHRIEPRPLAVAREQALPVYVQAYHAKVAKRGETLEISIDDKKVQTVRLIDTSELILMGNIYVTTPTLHELMARAIPISWHSFGGILESQQSKSLQLRAIPISWHSFGGWFMGYTFGTGHKNVELRTAQYRASFDERTCLHLAIGLIAAKIHNSRTLLRRNWKDTNCDPKSLLDELKHDRQHCSRATSQAELLGIEGAAAARYFKHFGKLIRSNHDDGELSFDFTHRNRRPPADPVNALLSFAYTLLSRTWHVTLGAVGFDAYRGFYHQPRYGRPALALDMMEPFRPIIADSAVLQAINNGEVRPSDFIAAAGAVALTPDGRKRFIAAFERRLSHEITHPLFGYRVSYRRLLEIQARLLGRYLLGDIPDYPNFTTR